MKNPMQKEKKVMQEPSWELSDTQPELEHQDWEKEWDNKFFKHQEFGAIENSDEMKPFIRQLLASEKEKGYQQGIKEAPESIGQYDEGYEEGAKSQKQEVIEIAEGTKKHKHLDNCNLQEISPEKCGWCLASNLHYNRALQDLINKLK